MPDPRELKVGDLVRFLHLPHEWASPGYYLHRDSRRFMRALIRRSWPSRVSHIDEDGYPWIRARTRERGKTHYHEWAIVETTGWRRVGKRR